MDLNTRMGTLVGTLLGTLVFSANTTRVTFLLRSGVMKSGLWCFRAPGRAEAIRKIQDVFSWLAFFEGVLSLKLCSLMCLYFIHSLLLQKDLQLLSNTPGSGYLEALLTTFDQILLLLLN